MEPALQMGEGDPRVPRLAAGWQERGRGLSPAEGFLLSRIDGRTPWDLLREIGGLPPEQVDRCLERWVADGLLEVEGDGPAGGAAGPEPVDESLEISVELQREILAFEASLDRSYHDLLGVPRSADSKAIKRAYFKLSKKFHPDRYFRREIGAFRERLEEIFKKLVEAYELLLDPATRAEVERSLASAAPPPAAEPQPERQVARKPSKRETLDRLRRRFRIPKEILAERKFRARQFFDASRVAFAQERWLEAAASARLAIAFDPWEAEYKRSFAKVQSKAYAVRAAELLEQAEASNDRSTREEALRLYEEVAHHRAGDAGVQHRVAALALDLGDFEKAREYAEAACEIASEVCAHHVTLGRALRKSGERDAARKALEAAARIDAKDPELRREQRALHQAGRRK